MFVLDAHQDIAHNTVCYGRDYLRSALKKRQLEAGTQIPMLNGNATLGLPEALAGRVAIVFATIFTAPSSANTSGWKLELCYNNPQEAYQQGMAQLDVYQKMADSDGRLRIIRTAQDLDDVLATWADGVPIQERIQGIVLLMENADPITEPRQFEAWYERGLRLVGPAWQATRYTAGTGKPGRLTSLGRELLEVMANFNAVLDVSHMAEDAYYESLDLYGGSIIASHSNPRHFCNTDRHLSDEMIRRMAERDGVIGIVLANHFLKGGWKSSDGKQAVTLDTALDAIDHICQVTGSVRHVGIGSDFDGGFGVEGVPDVFDTVADLWRFKDGLVGRGFADGDVANILHGNMLRKLREGLA
jgi:membrane dipeptidase